MTKIISIVTHAPHLDLPPPMSEPMPPNYTPPPIRKFVRLLRALKEWQRQGRPLTPKREREKRTAACEACELFRPEGNWGFGECGAPGCGCTNFKRWLATEKCPHPNGSRWPVNTVDKAAN
jgi:hypothetical protein